MNPEPGFNVRRSYKAAIASVRGHHDRGADVEISFGALTLDENTSATQGSNFGSKLGATSVASGAAAVAAPNEPPAGPPQPASRELSAPGVSSAGSVRTSDMLGSKNPAVAEGIPTGFVVPTRMAPTTVSAPPAPSFTRSGVTRSLSATTTPEGYSTEFVGPSIVPGSKNPAVAEGSSAGIGVPGDSSSVAPAGFSGEGKGGVMSGQRRAIVIYLFGEANFAHSVKLVEFLTTDEECTDNFHIVATELRDEFVLSATYGSAFRQNVTHLRTLQNAKVTVAVVLGIDARSTDHWAMLTGIVANPCIAMFHFIQSNDGDCMNSTEIDQSISDGFLAQARNHLVPEGQVLMCTQERQEFNKKYRGNHYGLSLSPASRNFKHEWVPLECCQFDHFYEHTATNAKKGAKVKDNNCVMWRFGKKETHMDEFEVLYRIQTGGNPILIGALQRDARDSRSFTYDYEDHLGTVVRSLLLMANLPQAGNAYPAVTYYLDNRETMSQEAGRGFLAAFTAVRILSTAKAYHNQSLNNDLQNYENNRRLSGAVVPSLNIGGNPPSFGFISVPSGYPAPYVDSSQYNTHPTPTAGLQYASPITVGYSMNPPMSTSSPSQSSLHPSFHPIHPTGPGSNPMFPMYGLTASHPHTVQSIPFYHQGAIGHPQVLYHQPLPSPTQSYPSVSVNNSALPPPATHSLQGMQRSFAQHQQPHASNSFQQQSPQQGQSSHAPQLPHSHQLSSHQPPLTQQHRHAYPHHNQQPSQHHQMLPSQPHPSPQQYQQQQSPHQPPNQQPPHQQMPHQPQHQHGLPPNLQHMPHQSSSMSTNHSMYPSNHHPSLQSSPQYPFSSMESPSNASSSSSSATRHPQQLPPPPSQAQHPQQHSQSH